MTASAGKVVMLVENLFPTDPRVFNEASTLSLAGYRVSVIALRRKGERAVEDVSGIRVYRIPRLSLFKKSWAVGMRGVDKRLHQLRAAVGYICEYIYFTGACLGTTIYIAVREGCDVIHAHNPPDTLVVVGLFHKLFGRKYVFDCHDLSPELYRSRFGVDSGPILRATMFVERLCWKVADHVVATNESYKQIAVCRGGIPAEKVTVVRNGPDLKRIRQVAPDEALLAMDKSIFVYVGAMNPQDGVDYLLRALKYLRDELGRRDFYCVIVGIGDSFEDLKTLALALKLEENVLFTGFVSDEELVRYLSTADICLDPNPSNPLNDVSTWIKVMEYMAMAKPTVSFDLKETRVTAAGAALYARPNSEADFATQIVTLMDSPELRLQMGTVGRLRIERELSWNVVCENLLRAYRQLLGSERRAPPRVVASP
jgi:glycosyltransferase involved in cell wall biosynthesis